MLGTSAHCFSALFSFVVAAFHFMIGVNVSVGQCLAPWLTFGNNDPREFKEHFQRLKALYNLMKEKHATH